MSTRALPLVARSVPSRPSGLPPLRPFDADLARRAPVGALIVKLAARCNMACDYCYWFRDETVMAAPKRMPPHVVTALLERVREHVERHALRSFTLILHGGEPLLFSKAGMFELCEQLRKLEAETACHLKLHVTTNGVLVDEDWALLFAKFGVTVTVSVDGPPEVHDRHRLDLAGRPTYRKVIDGIAHLRSAGIEPGVLCVADPRQSPAHLLAHLCDVLSLRELDVLVPDATHDEATESIGAFLCELFDLWFDVYLQRDVHIRLFEATIRALAGYSSGVESIGYGPVTGVTITTSGQIEAHDVCRIAKSGFTASSLNVQTHALDAVQGDPLWQEILDASLRLAPACGACRWRHACGGGHIASRWSAERRFDNPSVRCADLDSFLEHVWSRVGPSLIYVAEPTGAARPDVSNGSDEHDVPH